MCGIAGVVSNRTGDDVAKVECMANLLAHRGPDDEGVKVWPENGVAIAHRRLSIMDLSSAGRNPMANEDKTIWIVFNGEIYNFKELRQELEGVGHVFGSHSDTEVIIHAYEEWGYDHVQHLRGMFAYAIYDERAKATSSAAMPPQRGRIFLARDRLGIKPLFYYWDGQTFCFASEIKAILAWPGIDRSLDRSALYDYLTYLYAPTPKTAYLRIRKLPPAHFLILDGGPPQIKQYWRLELNRPGAVKTMSQAAEMIEGALEEAVRLHMVSDVDLGVFLSGGIDSSTITALMAKQSSAPVRTYTIGFDLAETDETPYARLVAEQFRTEHHEKIVRVGVVRDMLGRVRDFYGEPFADGSAVPTFYVSQAARENTKVALSGDGGDELFCGYNWYTNWLRRRRLSRLAFWPWRGSLAFLSDMASQESRARRFSYLLSLDELEHYAYLVELFVPPRKKHILNPTWQREFRSYDDYWYFRQFWQPDLDPITRVQYLDLHTYLPDDILTKVDRASMAVSLEVRPCLLDHPLVEKVFNVPAAIRFANGEKKALLKNVMKGILPPRILDRRKVGFGAPWNSWLDAEGKWAWNCLEQGALVGEGILDSKGLARQRRYAIGLRLWGLLVFEEWFRKEIGRKNLEA